MLDKRINATRDVQRAMRQYEQLIDDAMLAGLDLARTMLTSRREAHIRLDLGQDALRYVLLGGLQIERSRRGAIAAHAELSSVRTELNVTPQMTGDVDPTTPKPGTVNRGGLHVVHTAA